MVIFKEKKSRLSSNKLNLRVSLDARHSQKINEFKQASNNIDIKKKRLVSLNDIYEKLSAKPTKELSNKQYDLNQKNELINKKEKELNDLSNELIERKKTS